MNDLSLLICRDQLSLYNERLMENSITEIFSAFTEMDLFTIAASLTLFFAARPISRWLNDDDDLSTRASMMRALNFLIIMAVIINVFGVHKNDWLSNITQCLIVIYFAVLFTHIINFFIRQRFGKVRTSKNRVNISDTYSSRGLSLVVAAVMTIIAIVSCLQILGLNSLLEAGGAVGIVGIFLAMTQASWAPDIISGLIILNSRLCEEGDVIQFNMDGEKIVASIFRTKLFHTECLDLANNHRLMVRNAKLRDYGLQNLSRFASAKGLRERMFFNIDYQHSQEEVSNMMKRAFTAIDQSESTRETQFDPEILVFETGDHAVTWAVYYYIKDVKRLLYIKQIYRSYILAEAQRSNISLATPILQSNDVSLTQKGT
jgi:small-conductance mechanosensitive channel